MLDHSRTKGGKENIMKDDIRIMVAAGIMMAAIPCLAFVGREKAAQAEISAGSGQVGVYFCEEDKVREYSLDEYVIGAVLSQMPADLEEEALKAQGILARSYICRRAESEGKDPDPALKGALISDDNGVYQSFFTPEQAEVFYGEDHKEAYERVKKAVTAPDCRDVILTYEGEPVIAAYHAACAGRTRSALEAWGVEIPYLQSVESEEEECPETSTHIPAQELKEQLEELIMAQGEEPDMSGDPESWIETEQDEGGNVVKVVAFGTELSVSSFIDALGIASPCFEIRTDGDSFDITARGFGHMVGMSQYGANTMAKNGSSYEEILSHYYTGCSLEKQHYFG